MEIIAAAGNAPWSYLTFTTGKWILLDADGNEIERPAIGIPDAIPLAGDFRGDGTMELGLYIDGQWFIDVNGDGQWDAGDLWAKLGTREDQPVVGDWDGDGKDDIGIFGPAWPRDPSAIQHDPGLPDPMNKLVAGRHKKNVPPPEDLAAIGKRKMQAARQGQDARRADRPRVPLRPPRRSRRRGRLDRQRPAPHRRVPHRQLVPRHGRRRPLEPRRFEVRLRQTGRSAGRRRLDRRRHREDRRVPRRHVVSRREQHARTSPMRKWCIWAAPATNRSWPTALATR